MTSLLRANLERDVDRGPVGTVTGVVGAGSGPVGERLRLSVSAGDRQGVRPDRPFTAQLRVRLADAGGRGAPGQRISFRVVSGPARFGRGATAATARTDAGGMAIAPVLSALARPGAVSVTAVVVGAAEIRPASFVLRVIPAG